jgi:hypothetical protein
LPGAVDNQRYEPRSDAKRVEMGVQQAARATAHAGENHDICEA